MSVVGRPHPPSRNHLRRSSFRQMAARSRVARCSLAQPERAKAKELPTLKANLVREMATKDSLTMALEEKGRMVELLQEFSGQGAQEPNKVELAGTSWGILFTEATDGSAGVLGPIRGVNHQAFLTEPTDADSPGEFINSTDFLGGMLRVEGYGKYWPGADDKVEVAFTGVKFILLGFTISEKIFEKPARGFWKMIFADDVLRVFITNRRNAFALYNEAVGPSL